MLDERLNGRRYVGSGRPGSSRVGSARASSSRLGSARPSSDTRRPKLHTGRPSSAPVPNRPSSAPAQGRSDVYPISRPPLVPNKLKTHDVSHLNLKVEGKSIRSVAYIPRRHQPVNRGSVRVVSSHSHTIVGKRRPLISNYKLGAFEKQDGGSDSEASSFVGFGNTYTLPLSIHHPIVCGTAVSADQPGITDSEPEFGATFTKKDITRYVGDHSLGSTYTIKGDHNLGSTYSIKKNENAPRSGEYEYMGRSRRSSPEGRDEMQDGGSNSNSNSFVTTESGEKVKSATNKHDDHEFYGNSSYNTRPHMSDNRFSGLHLGNDSSRHVYLNGVSQLKRDTDTTSNEGSECTVMSLGRKIQIMANIPPNKEEDIEKDGKEDHWDTEWKQLLKQNHELLLKLSSRDEFSPHDDSTKCDHVKTVLVQHSGVQTNNVEKEGENMTLNSVGMSNDGIDFDSQDDIFQHEDCIVPDRNIGGEVFENSDDVECVLEDIIEESNSSNKSSPRSQKKEDDGMKMDAMKQDVDIVVKENQDLMKLDDISKTEMFLQLGKAETGSKASFTDTQKSLPKISSNSADFSCTADLPTYRSGLVTSYVAKSRFGMDKRVRSQPSKDLIEALQMIEDEERKSQDIQDQSSAVLGFVKEQGKSDIAVHVQDAGTDTKQSYDPKVYNGKSSEKFSGSPQSRFGENAQIENYNPSSLTSEDCPASLPVLQVLVEKVFLFTQDLAERWQQGKADGYCKDLLHQLMEAEKQLEGICVQEGLKEDPKNRQDLHTKCEEKAQKKQAESESRIQKNLELIRKLLDDKKSLTEQCERLHRDYRASDKKFTDKIKLLEENHSQEMKSMKERIIITEQEKREKWTQQRTKVIKESTYRGVETKIKDLSAKHRDEISQLKAEHWEALREAEEKLMSQLRSQEEELKKKFEQEKEEACKRERDREQQRLELEVRQSEQLSLDRLETVRKQQERDLKNLIEEHHHAMDRLRSENETSMRECTKEKERIRDELEEKIRTLNRKHEDELASLRHQDERCRSEWREQYMKEQQEIRAESERELRERLKRQRDKEIERAIKEIQQETTIREEEEHRTFDSKIKNLRERYENELNELETSEREARSRYLEMKSILSQKEEEIVYLRARLHTQDMELCELQHMLRPPDD